MGAFVLGFLIAFSVHLGFIFHGYCIGADAAGTCVFPAFSHKNKQTWLWLNERRRHMRENPSKPKDWSKYGKLRSTIAIGAESGDAHDEYLSWVSGGGSIESTSKFFLVNRDGPKRKSEVLLNSRNYGQDSIAAVNLKAGSIILEAPRHYCLSDELSQEDPLTLNGSPWEVRLATKILRERSKSKNSVWHPFIKLLPVFIRLPLFFSETELKNCEHSNLIKEVHLMRNFTEASFHALDQHETAGASFSDFVWALGVVYMHSCRADEEDLRAGPEHLVLPFFSSRSDSAVTKAAIKLHGKNLQLVMQQEAPQFSHISLDYHPETSSDAFLYHGFVPRALPHDRLEVFEGLQDLVDWFFLVHDEGRYSKDSKLRCAEAAENLYDQRGQRPLGLVSRERSRRYDYMVGPDGYVCQRMLYVVNALVGVCSGMDKAKRIVSNLMDGTDVDFQDMGNKSLYPREIEKIDLLDGVEPLEGVTSESGVASANGLLHKRFISLLDTYSTGLDEDMALLEASLWEGFNEDSGSHLCKTCQWPTEELSFNDHLAVQLRLRKKVLLYEALSMLKLSSSSEVTFSALKNSAMGVEEQFADPTSEFLKWCGEQGAELSHKLAVVHFDDSSNYTSASYKVRGVQAVQDIEEGEAICILPLDMGLFEKGSSKNYGADSWHLAAAHLLREKAHGLDSKWASYIAVLPRTMPTPIYLHPKELKEVQWWPVLRELIQVRQALRKSFAQFTAQEVAWADFEEYRWASTMVHSRAFTLPVEDDEQYASYVLMPFMDMINHHYNYQADWMSLPVRDGKLEIIAKRRVHKGQQLFASFGPRSNDNLFLYYGFVLEKNPFDTAQIFASFEDGVRWLIALWGSECEKNLLARARAMCEQKYWEKHWRIAKRAIENYAAGITEQRAEWWNLVNTWADYGYEYMQFQPSPSLYIDGIVDPTLIIAFEAVAGAMGSPKFRRYHDVEDCKYGTCDSKFLRSNLADFFTCIGNMRWPDAHEALHSTLCTEYVSQALVVVEKTQLPGVVAKLSLAMRCLEILSSFPTTIEEDKLLLEGNLASKTVANDMHLNLTRQYRYLKKVFLKDHIDHVLNWF